MFYVWSNKKEEDCIVEKKTTVAICDSGLNLISPTMFCYQHGDTSVTMVQVRVDAGLL